eukprot:CAMPEP_0170542240 /NCGR_PEP_ID=MMETSP0211-20121228/1728_1 /TAXON_ID=311385 /ORGANISM="Pseudokeronopsis sp., Strain OXSARD2" /LENGTH=47 /DNA_ID= /DNA_START= /DNA_END= /DNA_ORIENTATION=
MVCDEAECEHDPEVAELDEDEDDLDDILLRMLDVVGDLLAELVLQEL